VLLGKALYFGVISFISSKWKFIVFQSTQALHKMSHDNPMMIGFVGDDLKTTLLLCDPIVTINILVSCVIGPEKRFRPSIILTAIGVIFSTNAKLCYRTNSLSMKHADAPNSRSAWVRTVVDSPPLIVMGNKNTKCWFWRQSRTVLNAWYIEV
jgi:hypothetical protein